MNAEYMGAKTMDTVGLGHAPGCVLTAPASTVGKAPPSTLLDVLASTWLETGALVFELPPEHAATAAATPTLSTPIPSANDNAVLVNTTFIIALVLW